MQVRKISRTQLVKMSCSCTMHPGMPRPSRNAVLTQLSTRKDLWGFVGPGLPAGWTLVSSLVPHVHIISSQAITYGNCPTLMRLDRPHLISSGSTLAKLVERGRGLLNLHGSKQLPAIHKQL